MNNKNKFLQIVITTIAILFMVNFSYSQLSKIDNEIFTSEITIKFKSEAFNSVSPLGIGKLKDLKGTLKNTKNYLEKFNKIQFRKLFTNASWGDTIKYNKQGKKVKVHDLSQFFTIEFSEPVKMWETVYALRGFPDIEFADPPVTIINQIEPDDPSYQADNQWYLTKIEAEDAWNISIGKNTVKIGIIDDGVNSSHADLSSKISGGESGYYDGNNNHGTLVAGVAGAATDNGTGIASLGWNTSITPYKSETISGHATDINSAVSNGVDIINCSWSVVTIDPYDNTKYVNYNYSPLASAISNAIAQGVVVIASAGNPPPPITFSDDITRYPSEYPPYPIWPASYNNVIGVSATNSSDEFPTGYNYGTPVDVSAPGINIRTTDPNGGYSSPNGTSFSSPLVAAFAGLILSINPELTVSDVSDIITSSAFDLGTNGRDDYFGYGRINAKNGLLKTLDILADNNNTINYNATGSNGSRKIEIDGSSYQYRHLIFASGGEIYYRRRPVWTSVWSASVRLSVENGANNFPSISVRDDGRIVVCWQRQISSSSFGIWAAMSDDNGVTWNTDGLTRLTTVSISDNPLPVVQADYDGSYFDLVYRNNDGLKSYTSSDGELWYGTTFTYNNNSGDCSPSLANDWSFGNTCLVYETATKKIFYRNRLSYLGYTYNWSNTTDLTYIIPGTNYSHETPSISTEPDGEGYDIHVAWHRIYGNGSGVNDHSIIYRRANNYNEWPNEYTAIYYQNQKNPVITATDDFVYIYYQLVSDDDIYKQQYNGSYWTGPTYVNNGKHPSISTGKISALPVWTTNSTAPYEVEVGSQTLNKISSPNIDTRTFYNRSIAVLDSAGNYIELLLKNILLIKHNGKKLKLPIKMVSLDTFKLRLDNCWGLLSSEFVTVPDDAESLFIDYEIKTSDYDKLSENDLNGHRIYIEVNNQDKSLITSKLDLQLSEEFINSSSKRTAKLSINSLRRTNIYVALKLENYVPVKSAFTSLGHIYDFSTMDNNAEETVFAILDSSSFYKDYSLNNVELQSFPNPFNSQIRIEFDLPESQNVSVRIFNIKGQLVYTIVSDFLNKGSYHFNFNATQFASGIYLIELKVKEKRVVNRILLIK